MTGYLFVVGTWKLQRQWKVLSLLCSMQWCERRFLHEERALRLWKEWRRISVKMCHKTYSITHVIQQWQGQDKCWHFVSYPHAFNMFSHNGNNQLYQRQTTANFPLLVNNCKNKPLKYDSCLFNSFLLAVQATGTSLSFTFLLTVIVHFPLFSINITCFYLISGAEL